MLAWTIIFLVAALLAGILGFANVVPSATPIARILFFVFLVMFAMALMTGTGRHA
jgi:uncharacterized membrane protein YtjA (UPF0391 family)